MIRYFMLTCCLLAIGCATVSFPLYVEKDVVARYPALAGRVVEAKAYQGKGETPPGKEIWLVDENVKLDTGMKVKIDVEGNDDLSRIVTIPASGTIELPMAGTVNVRGRTLHEARNELTAKYRLFLRDPKVHLAVSAAEKREENHRIITLGMIRWNPKASGDDSFPYRPSLFVVLNRGVLRKDAAPSQIIVLRGDTAIVCNYLNFMINKVPADNFPLKDGDIVIVPRTYEDESAVLAEWDVIAKYLGGALPLQAMMVNLKQCWSSFPDAP